MRIDERLVNSYRLDDSDLDLDAARAEIGRRIARRGRAPLWQRRATWLIPVIALLAVGVPAVESLAPAGHPVVHVSPPPAPPAGPSGPQRVALRPGAQFDQISLLNGALELSGTTTTTATGGTTCTKASVDPQTLKVGPVSVGSCTAPAANGQTASIVNSYVPSGSNTGATIQITTVDPATGKVSVGPVVMTYQPGSDSHVVTAYGDGLLWVYDVDASQGPALLEVSAATGYVKDVVAMPKLYRPIVAINDSGLWIANSYQGSDGIAPLYLLKPGASALQVVVPTSTLVACWTVADRGHLWVGMGLHYGCANQEIWRFDGANSHPTYQVPEAGYEPLNVIGNESDELWSVVWTNPTAKLGTSESREVVRIDPDSGRETVVETLPPVSMPAILAMGLAPGEAVISQGSIYLLDAPPPNGTDSYTSLVKITLPAATGATPSSPVIPPPPNPASFQGLGPLLPTGTARSSGVPVIGRLATPIGDSEFNTIVEPPAATDVPAVSGQQAWTLCQSGRVSCGSRTIPPTSIELGVASTLGQTALAQVLSWPSVPCPSLGGPAPLSASPTPKPLQVGTCKDVTIINAETGVGMSELQSGP